MSGEARTKTTRYILFKYNTVSKSTPECTVSILTSKVYMSIRLNTDKKGVRLKQECKDTGYGSLPPFLFLPSLPVSCDVLIKPGADSKFDFYTSCVFFKTFESP